MSTVKAKLAQMAGDSSYFSGFIAMLEDEAYQPVAFAIFFTVLIGLLCQRSPTLSGRARRFFDRATGRKKDRDDGSHSWINPHGQTYSSQCCVCHELLGFSGALECEECIILAHTYCAAAAPHNCKAWHEGSTSISFRVANTEEVSRLPTGLGSPLGRRAASTGVIAHQFMQGNLSVGSLCFVCKENCGSLVGLGGLQCLWCGRTVHKECIDTGDMVCDLGRHGKLTLSPCEVTYSSGAPPTRKRQSSRGGAGSSATDSLRRRAKQMKASAQNAYRRMSRKSSALMIRENFEFRPSQYSTPLIVFVNRKSGGNAGAALLRKFRQVLNPLQVFDLADAGPEVALNMYKSVPRVRILVCGGDGTVGWVLSQVDRVPMAQVPPVAVIPLGTGNDLARSLKWGGGYSKSHSIEDILFEITQARVSLLDRWSIDVTVEGNPKENKEFVMNNYLGLGVDAHIAHDFHRDRETFPSFYKSQFVNRVWGYGLGGASQMIERSCRNLEQQMDLFCDGKKVELPANIEGIIFLNIESYGGGLDLWGEERDERYTDVSTHDKKLEIIAVHGSWNMGRMQLGLQTSAIRIAQCSSATIKTRVGAGREKVPMQVDGEPWHQAPCTMTVTHKNQAFMLSRATEDKDRTAAVMNGVLEWAESGNVITTEQKNILLKEVAVRLAEDERRKNIGEYA